ncbi:uncharacterized protein TM35_000152190 [Trypanosoma theileri]|uniref:Calpain-like cysteine peptidase n=1 Tax=Trypanosoma theileri TaxID=67003 RepID=A0A1X0NW77_9TRYP|nr:uncharacterized protein TM35_000152190 [Trypanosoma theileri]ORC88788.1 hypothetical protein TM35_000152190 [Trypanosoma theileri]
MTTMQKVDATLERFDRKSPRAAYAQVCEEMGVHRQKSIAALLSDAPRDWDKHRVFDCRSCVLGPKGAMAIVPLLLCSRSLRRVCMRGCGVTDEFVAQLAETLQDHQCIRSVDVGDNPLVTIYSADPVIKLLRANKNIVRFALDGTHIGTNVANLISDLCDANHDEVANYYADDFFRMKNIFNYLDGDGSGWVLLRSLVLNAPYPVLQEQLIERIALRRPRKRSDGTISVNTFLELVYFNYKTEVEVAKRAKEVDTEYNNIVINWKRLLEVMDSTKEEEQKKLAEAQKNAEINKKDHDDDDDDDDEFGSSDDDLSSVGATLPPNIEILPPTNLHRLRIRTHELHPSEAREIIAAALKFQLDADARSLAEESTSPSNNNNTNNNNNNNNDDENDNEIEKENENDELDPKEMDATTAPHAQEQQAQEEKQEQGGFRKVRLSIPCLRRAYRSVTQPQPLPNRYRFLREHEEDYIPPIMRAGSRLISISKLSFLDSFRSSGGMSATSVTSEGVDYDGDETRVRWWALPPAMVRLVTKFFNKQAAKLPKKRQSTLAISPRTQRDNAMQKSAIPVTAFLAAEFVTDLETLRPRLLADKFLQYSIPIDVSTITLQEIVNCLNEFYTEISVEKVFTVSQIRKMPTPTNTAAAAAGGGTTTAGSVTTEPRPTLDVDSSVFGGEM